MSRLPASALEEGDQIHAILRPLLAEAGAAKRRAAILAGKPDQRTVPFAELDQAIDALVARMRVDPRPPKQKTRDVSGPSTREAQRQKPATEPPEPPPTHEAKRPPTRPVSRPTPVAMPDLPPPVPPPKTREAETTRPSFDENPPPVPVQTTTTRNMQRPTPPIPAAAPALPKRATMPVRGMEDASGPLVLARPGNAPETFLLYDDIVMLSAMNDRDGLMISLERLLILAKLEDHVRVFIDANEAKLVGLYESQLKSFSRVPQKRGPAVDNTMPRVFLRGEKVAAVLPLLDGKQSIADIVQKCPLSRIETLSVLAQLQRAGLLET